MFLALAGRFNIVGEIRRMWEASASSSEYVEKFLPYFSAGLSSRDQYYQDDRYLVACRMRLDNKTELTRQLSLGLPISDSFLVLQSYQRWGTNFTSRLLGDFALFIFDQKTQTLFCARDQLGIVPLFYAKVGEGLIFGTNLRGVLAHPLTPARHDLGQIGNYLSYLQYPRLDRTFFKHVHKLPPGHQFVYGNNSLTLSRYWEPTTVSVRFKNRRDYVERLDELVRIAVDCRMNDSAGVHLSGGLDSSVIAVLTSSLTNRDVNSFSWSSPPPGPTRAVDERHRILQICSQTDGLSCQFFRRFTSDYVEILRRDITRQPTVMLAFEEPVQKVASKLGLTTLLSGWGGDEFCSYNGRGVLASQFLKFHWLYVLRECLGASTRIGGGNFFRQFLNKVVRPLSRSFQHNQVPPTSYLHPSLRTHLTVNDQDCGFQHVGANQNMTALFNLGHLQERIEHWTESGERYGIRYAFPLLDRRIVEFALGIPETLFHSGGFTRAIFRDVCARYLPHNQVWGQPKNERAVTLQWTHQGCEEAREFYFREVEKRAVNHPYVDGPKLLREWDLAKTQSKLKERAKACLFIVPS